MTFISEMTPGTLEKKGVAYAPRTLASLVYMNDGSKISDVLNDMMQDGKRFIMQTKTDHLQIDFDRQRIYDIPIPIEKYDFKKYPVVISLNNVFIESSNYMINNSQLILNEDFALTVNQNDILTFIFHYLDIIIEDDGLNAESVNNIRYFVLKEEPKCKQTTDVWFDTSLNQVKQFNGEEWEIIVSGTGGSGSSTIASFKSSVSISTKTPYVDIGIENFDKDGDILFVYQNSVYLHEGEDYALDNNRRIRSLTGDWNGTEEVQTFNFIVLKNVEKGYEGINGSLLKDHSIDESKLSEEVIAKLNSGGGGTAGSVLGSNVVQSPEYRLVSDDMIKKWNNYESVIESLLDKIAKYEDIIENDVLVINNPISE